MLDALGDTNHSRRRIARESLALMWASGVAWQAHLSSPQAARTGATFGALIWFGFLLGAGPAIRVSTLTQPRIDGPLHSTPVLLAALFLVGSVLVIGRSRLLAASLGVCGVAAAGVSGMIGSWSFSESVLYEARWSGFALALVIGLTQTHKSLSVSRTLAPLAMAAIVTLAMRPITMFGSLRSYAMTIRFEFYEPLSNYVAQSRWEWLFAVAFFTSLAMPFAIRAVAAAAAPVALHLFLLDARTGLVAATYLAAAFAVHYLRRDLTIALRRKPQSS
jgi:hypothetical protein